MPIFGIEDGKPVPVTPMLPAAGSFEPHGGALVTDHLAEVLGEELLPVAHRQDGQQAPYLLAVDAASQPVVVEVVQLLDAEHLVRALRYAGHAGRLSNHDLAQRYHRGAERFASDLVSFRGNVPITRLHRSAGHAGARLVLVCAEVDEDCLDAVEFLRQPGWQVEVLQVGVLRGADGRRMLDVSPLVTGTARRSVEPTTLRLLPSDLAYAEVMAHDAPAPPEAPADREPARQAHDATARPAQAPLALLASAAGGPSPLVWIRARRHQRFDAVLLPGGVLRLPDGREFTDPGMAAGAVSGAEYVDGWRAWRFGDGGPSLAEAYAEIGGVYAQA